MITETVIITAILAVTLIVISDLTRRYYETKQELEYRRDRLRHDETVLADGGEDEEF